MLNESEKTQTRSKLSLWYKKKLFLRNLRNKKREIQKVLEKIIKELIFLQKVHKRI